MWEYTVLTYETSTIDEVAATLTRAEAELDEETEVVAVLSSTSTGGAIMFRHRPRPKDVLSFRSSKR